MTILLSTLVVAFAAFCVWLTVRIVNRRDRWVKRMAVLALALLVAYPLSIGPMSWLSWRGFVPHRLFSVVYEPLDVVANNAPTAVAYPVDQWILLWYDLAGFTPDSSGPVLFDRKAK
jgi:hypothetical protein